VVIPKGKEEREREDVVREVGGKEAKSVERRKPR